MLETSRQLLDEGRFEDAESLASNFISTHSDHPKLSTALMVRGYAREKEKPKVRKRIIKRFNPWM